VITAVLADEGFIPLGTGGLTAPRPVAAIISVAPGVVFTIAVLGSLGPLSRVTNMPRSDAATFIGYGALVSVSTVTVILTDGTLSGISNGTCTLSCVGLI
jgi:hypothetical protein